MLLKSKPGPSRVARTYAWVPVLVGISSVLWYLPSAKAEGPGEMDTQRSTITVRVYKTGLFSAFAHDHEIQAPIQQGSFDEGKQTVELVVDARTLRVLDPGTSASDRAQIQATMLGPKVLDSEKFQEINFHSTRIEHSGDAKWSVAGDLLLHGETHPVNVIVEGQGGHYHGSASLKQKDFGITPVSIAGGSVKVKNEVKVEFEIFGR